MGEFYKTAERIFGRLQDRERGIRASEIPNIAGDMYGQEINCYPGIPGHTCYEFALFVSLNTPAHAEGTKHFKFRKALETIIQHVEDTCPDQVRAIALITDSWDAKAFEEWRGMLEKVSQRVHFEIYLLANRDILQIKI